METKYVLGVCAMDKKAKSEPMQQILKRLTESQFEVIVFGDDMLLNRDMEEWPICDALIAFFSMGFPLDKAEAYVKLRSPVLVNELSKQRLLMDRRDVYNTLKAADIPLPNHIIVNRNGVDSMEHCIEEFDDYIVIDGHRMDKPFVEKPVDGEDHRIHIYYPMSAGGGCKMLFRKVGNRSSDFDPNRNSVRTLGSYIYEEFLTTEGTDVKVYTIGPNYAHAEARKSPVLDGKVLRDSTGKEVRYPVILSTEEKEIARKVCKAFEQTVCGFDILRGPSGSFVCDVNGWSFVKNSKKYYDDCAILLRKFLLRALRYQHAHASDARPMRSISVDLDDLMECEGMDGNFVDGYDKNNENSVEPPEELRCVIAVIRHGDRTPKQKLKMMVCHDLFIKYYRGRTKNPRKDLKLKAVADLEALLEVAKHMIHLYESKDEAFKLFLDNRENLNKEESTERMKGIRTLRDVLERWQLCGINRKVQLKPREWENDAEGKEVATRLLLILKWGGDLTASGMEQAESLGSRFRHQLYPGYNNGGLLRLHSTYRHDLKIYTSDEGRVQKTAAAFAKGFLELEGDLIPILVSLVLKGKDANSMLDQSGTRAQSTIIKIKERLHDLLHHGDDCSTLKQKSDSDLLRSVAAALDVVDNPTRKMEIMYGLLCKLKDQLIEMTRGWSEDLESSYPQPVGRETLPMLTERWMKLYRDFYSKKKTTYDLSKIPDIYDCIRYDAIHNAHLKLVGISELYEVSKMLAHALVPQEYGMHIDEKVEIGQEMCRNLLVKLRDDLHIATGNLLYRLHPQYAKDKYVKSTHRSVRTRLYFTSESHIYTLLNVLRFSAEYTKDRKQSSDQVVAPSPITPEGEKWLSGIEELGYMTHIVIRLFERFEYDEKDPRRFRAEMLLSAGCVSDPYAEVPMEIDLCKFCSNKSLTCEDFLNFMNQALQNLENQDKEQNFTPPAAPTSLAV